MLSELYFADAHSSVDNTRALFPGLTSTIQHDSLTGFILVHDRCTTFLPRMLLIGGAILFPSLDAYAQIAEILVQMAVISTNGL